MSKYLAKIIANDQEGLQMISACVSGSKTKVDNIKYLASSKVFLLSIERTKIESDQMNKKINSICRFDFVDKVLINLGPGKYSSIRTSISTFKALNLVYKFEIYGFSFEPNKNDKMTEEIKKDFFTFYPEIHEIINKKKNVLGHSDISPGRKKDPGEKFPWETLAKNKLSFWHSLDQKKIKKFREKNLITTIEENLFLKNLHKIGYNDVKKFKSHKNTKYLTLAFQRRFRQSLVNGKIDKECLLISKNLL